MLTLFWTCIFLIGCGIAYGLISAMDKAEEKMNNVEFSDN